MLMKQDAIDVRAETAECDRIWALDDDQIDTQLRALGLDPVSLFPGLDAIVGADAEPAPEVDLPCSGEAAAAPRPLLPARPCRAPDPPAILYPAAPAALAADKLCAPTFQIAGRVKFFDPLKRFGFIVPDDGGDDVLLHISCLQAAGHATAYEGARIQALVHSGPRGLQALQVLSMDDSTAIHPAQAPQRTHVKVQAESDWERMIVRWYNFKQGYGFISEGEGMPDVFVHADTLRRWGMAVLRPGQVVEVRWGMTSNGRMAAEIRRTGGSAGLPAVH